MFKIDVSKILSGVIGGGLALHYVKEAMAEFATAMISLVRDVTSSTGIYGSIIGAIGIAAIVLLCAGNRIMIDN